MTRFLRSLAVICLAAGPVSAQAQTPAPAPAPAPPPTSPLTIRLGDADFLIGGFLDAAAVVRSTNVGNGLATPYATIPYGNTPQGRQLLVARRLVERGVRFVQVWAGGWDHHQDIEERQPDRDPRQKLRRGVHHFASG